MPEVFVILLLALLFFGGWGLIVAANRLFGTLLREVNLKGSVNQPLEWLLINGKYRDVIRRHAELFPASRKRRGMMALVAAGAALQIAAIVLGFLRFGGPF